MHPPALSLGAVRRSRAYVHRIAFCLYAGEMLRPAFPAESLGLAGAGLYAGLADVADPEAAGWLAGDAVASWVGGSGRSRSDRGFCRRTVLIDSPRRHDGP